MAGAARGALGRGLAFSFPPLSRVRPINAFGAATSRSAGSVLRSFSLLTRTGIRGPAVQTQPPNPAQASGQLRSALLAEGPPERLHSPEPEIARSGPPLFSQPGPNETCTRQDLSTQTRWRLLVHVFVFLFFSKGIDLKAESTEWDEICIFKHS